MAAGDVTGLMRNHTDDLAGIFRFHKQACIDEKSLPAGDKGVQGRVIDDVNLDIAGFETGGFEDRLGVHANGIFDLRVADQRNSACRRLTGQRNQNSPENRQKTANIFGTFYAH